MPADPAALVLVLSRGLLVAGCPLTAGPASARPHPRQRRQCEHGGDTSDEHEIRRFILVQRVAAILYRG